MVVEKKNFEIDYFYVQIVKVNGLPRNPGKQITRIKRKERILIFQY